MHVFGRARVCGKQKKRYSEKHMQPVATCTPYMTVISLRAFSGELRSVGGVFDDPHPPTLPSEGEEERQRGFD